jgi:tetratricopeptide (TPR) repeat protein
MLRDALLVKLAAVVVFFSQTATAAQSAPLSNTQEAWRLMDGYQHKGWALKSENRIDEAEACQHKALEIAEKNLNPSTYPTVFAGICYDIGECLEQENRYREALAEFDRAISYARMSSKLPNTFLSRVDLAKGKTHLLTKQYSEAQPLLQAVIAQYQGDHSQYHFESVQYFEASEAAKLLGDTYAAQNKLPLARTAYEKSLSLLPETYLSRNSPLRLPALQAYKTTLDKLGRREDSERIAKYIKTIEAAPEVGIPCGTAQRQHQQWLNWHP